MIKSNRHCVYPAILTKYGRINVGVRRAVAAVPETVLTSGAIPGPSTRVAGMPMGGSTHLLNAIRPFSSPKARLDVIALPAPVETGLKEFYEINSPLGGTAGVNPPISGLEFMGWGYDISGNYSSAAALKWPLLDFATIPLKKCDPPFENFGAYDFVKVINFKIANTSHFSGETASEYQTSMSLRAGLEGSFKGFSGQVNLDYSTTELHSSVNIFIRTRQVIQKWALHLDPAALKSHLSQEAKQDLDGNMPPTQVFDKYGAYFVTGIIVGGKVYQNFTLNRYKVTDTSSLEVSAEAGFLNLIKVSGGVLTQSASTFMSQAEQSDITSMGGDESLGGGRLLEDGGYGRWADSVDANPVFVDFTEKNAWPGLKPIWELCSSNTRKNALMSAFNSYQPTPDILPTNDLLDYGVGIKTSTRDDAGTDAMVSIELGGKNGKSGLIRLGDEPNWFEKGSEDYFNVKSQDLGELTSVRLKHDNSGKKAGWYVNYVRVTVGQRMWEFKINSWLAKDMSPKKTDITFNMNGDIIATG